jgi:hypothetical protein
MDEKYGMKVILWSVDPFDWRYRNSERVSSTILKNAKPGDIILSHDIHPTTIAAMPTVFDTLLSRGYKFVTVSELIAKQTPAPAKGMPAGAKASPNATVSPAERNPSPPPEGSPSQSPSPSASPNLPTGL